MKLIVYYCPPGGFRRSYIEGGVKKMTRLILFPILCLSCFGGSDVWRKALDSAVDLQGYPCAKGYAWFFDGGRLKQCTLAREAPFGEAVAPAGSIVVLRHDGAPNYLMLVRNSMVRGLPLKGGGPLGPAEGATTAFYPSGKLKEAWLAEDHEVDGVPCMAAGGFFSAVAHRGGISTVFYEDGTLKSCTLSRDYEGLKRGTMFLR
jgi:hypothetical protein